MTMNLTDLDKISKTKLDYLYMAKIVVIAILCSVVITFVVHPFKPYSKKSILSYLEKKYSESFVIVEKINGNTYKASPKDNPDIIFKVVFRDKDINKYYDNYKATAWYYEATEILNKYGLTNSITEDDLNDVYAYKDSNFEHTFRFDDNYCYTISINDDISAKLQEAQKLHSELSKLKPFSNIPLNEEYDFYNYYIIIKLNIDEEKSRSFEIAVNDEFNLQELYDEIQKVIDDYFESLKDDEVN